MWSQFHAGRTRHRFKCQPYPDRPVATGRGTEGGRQVVELRGEDRRFPHRRTCPCSTPPVRLLEVIHLILVIVEMGRRLISQFHQAPVSADVTRKVMRLPCGTGWSRPYERRNLLTVSTSDINVTVVLWWFCVFKSCNSVIALFA